jgi:hypothetical protein
MEKEPSGAIKKIVAEKDAEIDRLKSLLIRAVDELHEVRTMLSRTTDELHEVQTALIPNFPRKIRGKNKP